MTKGKVIIIGGGIAGLSAGIVGRLNGFETHIFEMHSIPGGLCTGWKRRGYTFDGCIRYLYGTLPGGWGSVPMRLIGALTDGTVLIHHPEKLSVETSQGEAVSFYADVDKLEQHLLDVAPADAKQIRIAAATIRRLGKGQVPDGIAYSTPAALRRLPGFLRVMPDFMRWTRISMREFSAGLNSPVLREAFDRYYAYSSLPDLPIFFPLLDLAQRNIGNAAVPQGGSLAVAFAVAHRYRELGGEITYHARVDRILVEDGRAVGVRVTGPEGPVEHRADAVISAADAHVTLQMLLEGRHSPPEFIRHFTAGEIIKPVVQVSLGVARTFKGVPRETGFHVSEPVVAAGLAWHDLCFEHYGSDSTMAPEGKTAVVMMLETEYAPWRALADRGRDVYEMAKSTIAEQSIDRLNERFPGIRNQVEVVDVATPLTTERYTGNHLGSPQGWQTTTKNLRWQLPTHLSGLERFTMAGQWVQLGGGIPGGAISGYAAIRRLCKELGQPFESGY